VGDDRAGKEKYPRSTSHKGTADGRRRVSSRAKTVMQQCINSTFEFWLIFRVSSGAWDAERRIVLDDIVGTLEQEFPAAEVANGAPATMDVGPIKQLETIRIGMGCSLAMGLKWPPLNTE